MSREDIHTTLEKIRMKGVWGQGILIGKWARRRIYPLALAGMFLLIGAAFLTPMLLGVRATSSEQFTSAGDWSTYGYDNARDSFNAAETIITPSTAPLLKQKWAHYCCRWNRLLGFVGWLCACVERQQRSTCLVCLHRADDGLCLQPAARGRRQFTYRCLGQRPAGCLRRGRQRQFLCLERQHRQHPLSHLPGRLPKHLHLGFARGVQWQHLYWDVLLRGLPPDTVQVLPTECDHRGYPEYLQYRPGWLYGRWTVGLAHHRREHRQYLLRHRQYGLLWQYRDLYVRPGGTALLKLERGE